MEPFVINHPVKKSISEATKTRYRYALQSIYKNIGTFIPDITTKQCVDYVMNETKHKDGTPMSLNLRRLYLSALMWDTAERPEDYALIKQAFDKIRAGADAETKSQTISDARLENYVKWETILEGAKFAKQQYEAGNMTLNDYTIVCLYTLQNPVRADYGEMRVVKSLASCNPSKNYFLINPDNVDDCYFYFRNYKTSEKYGEVRVKAHRAIVELTLEKKKGVFHGGLNVISQSRDSLTKRIPKIFQNLVGKPVSVSLLRHSFITWWLKNNPEASIAEKEEIARTMLHSRFVQETYRILPAPANLDPDETPSPIPDDEIN